MPYYPSADGGEEHWKSKTSAEKLVSDYTGLNFLQLQDLSYYDYLLCLRDAVIHQCMETDKGREYLENAWIITQTKPDREAIREKIAKQ